MTRAATATIRLDAFKHNLQCIKKQAPRSKVLAVIKANGYGHGMLRAARALDDADAYAVARIEEAMGLRNAVVDKRIVLLQGFADAAELAQISQLDIDVVVHHQSHLEILENTPLAKPVTVWLKIDTGMHRLGFSIADAQQAWQQLHNLSNVAQPIYVMSHFANADIAGDRFTQHQIEQFEKITKGWSAEKSLANSAGIFSWPASHFDWVRPGISLYGISPYIERDGNELGLRPVMQLTSRIVSIKTLRANDAVGYGHHWRAHADTRIAVVGIGYADGYPRHAPNGTPVMINGKRCSLIGRVSMDSLGVELGNDCEAKIGDEVELWGDQIHVEEVARLSNTIPYELVCKVASRVRFIEES